MVDNVTLVLSILNEHYVEYLTAHDFNSLSLACSVFQRITTPTKEKYFPFRIPDGEQATLYSPQRVIVSSLLAIPPKAKHIRFTNDFNDPFELVDILQSKITRIKFGKFFNHPVSVENLPPLLKELTFGEKFNFPVDNLPSTLRQLSLGGKFNHLVNSLPPYLTQLSFGYVFNKKVDQLPPSLTQLSLGWKFNQEVNHILPLLTKLSFSASFNQNVDHLPPSLTQLVFKHNFNQPVDHLPPSLTYLAFGFSFNQPVEHLPQSLKTLIFGKAFNKSLDFLPTSISAIKLGFNFNLDISHLDSFPFLLHLEFEGGELWKPMVGRFVQKGVKVVVGKETLLPK